ncbi:hypothetical protein HRbin36_02735 [bacterium HR36]|nr:hypothetical protein HRbin36_02735 [bacterium HR36]
MRKRKWLWIGLAAWVSPNLGCITCGYHYFHDLADPRRLPRYSAIARQEVAAPIAQQVGNGLALEHTVWNSHFRAGTDELTPAGMAHLSRLARRQPEPLPYIFVQTAHDLPLERGKEQEWAQKRQELDSRRVQAVQAYLKAVRPEVAFQVAVHDPPEVSNHGQEAQQAVRSMHRSAQGQATFSAFTSSTAGTAAGAATGSGPAPGASGTNQNPGNYR